MRLTAVRVLAAVTLLTAMVVGGAIVQWSARHPLSASWDEADYINLTLQLDRTARDQGLLKAGRQLVSVDPARPPMYRAAALPVAALVGTDARVLRALSLVALLLTGVLLYRIARLVADPPVALVAAAVFVLSYAPLWASAQFGTEYVLYLGTAGLFYGLLLAATRPERSPVPIGGLIAVSVALGLLSKGTFLLVVVPAVPAFLLAGARAGVGRRALWVVAVAAAAGFAIAAPWYAVNYSHAIAFGRGAYHFVRHEAPWLPEAFWRLLGPPFAALVLAAAAFLVVRRRRLREAMSPRTLLALGVCVAGAAPMLIFHVFQPNHLMRLTSPALIPLLLGVALAVQSAGGLAGGRAVAVAAAAVALQGAYMTHRFASSRMQQWDWAPLRALADQHGLPRPTVAYLGSGITFDPPSIARPWIEDGREIRVTWLWRQERGPIDWGRVVSRALAADVVVTAPGYAGDPEDKGELDNQYNAELATRLEGMGAFEAPAELRLGRDGTLVVALFRKRPGSTAGAAASPPAPERPPAER